MYNCKTINEKNSSQENSNNKLIELNGPMKQCVGQELTDRQSVSPISSVYWSSRQRKSTNVRSVVTDAGEVEYALITWFSSSVNRGHFPLCEYE
jgi:uncharacterized protein (UPF0210 family)